MSRYPPHPTPLTDGAVVEVRLAAQRAQVAEQVRQVQKGVVVHLCNLRMRPPQLGGARVGFHGPGYGWHTWRMPG